MRFHELKANYKLLNLDVSFMLRRVKNILGRVCILREVSLSKAHVILVSRKTWVAQVCLVNQLKEAARSSFLLQRLL